MAKYLFTMWDGGGTVPPELAIARRLVARGHDVRVLADPTIASEARAAGCQFFPWTTAPHRTSRAREHDVFRDYDFKNPMEMIGRYIEDFLAKPSPRWIADTLATVDRHGADAIVTDFGLPAPLIAAEARGLASAVVLPNIWIYPTKGIPPMGPGFMPATGLLGRLRDTIFGAMTRRAFDKALPHFNEARKSLGLPPAASAHGQMQRADRILVLTSPKFDFFSPAMPEHVRYTGPELEDPAWAEPWRSPWKDDDLRPLVAVGLSSTFQDQVPLLNRIVDALSMLDVRALVTLGIALDASEVREKGNVVVVPTAPHRHLPEGLRRHHALRPRNHDEEPRVWRSPSLHPDGARSERHGRTRCPCRSRPAHQANSESPSDSRIRQPPSRGGAVSRWRQADRACDRGARGMRGPHPVPGGDRRAPPGAQARAQEANPAPPA